MHLLATTIPKMEIDVDRMRENLELTKGLIFAEAITAAWGEKVGRSRARELMDAAADRASKEKRNLREIIEGDEHLKKHFSPGELDGLFDARNYSGAANHFIDQVIEANKSTEKDK